MKSGVASTRTLLRHWSRLVHQRHGGAAAALAGIACALAQPPFGLTPGLLGFAVLAALLDATSVQKPLRSAFWRGWMAGTTYFLIAVWWVSEAFMVDVAAHGWQAPFAVAFLAAGLGLLWGAAASVYRWLAGGLIARRSPWRVLVFAGLFGLIEWLRGHILTGFPWDLPGEAWRAGSVMSQFAAVVGVYGLTFLTLLVAAGPATLADRIGWRKRFAAPVVSAIVLAGLWGFGTIRLAQPEAQTSAQGRPDGLVVRVVQANVAQAAKWDIASFTDILNRYTRLTGSPASGRRPDLVVWSETAIPALIDDYLAPGTWTRAEIEASLQPGQTLVFGADREENTGGQRKDFNSLLLLRRQTDGFRLLGGYDKHHLVPFGEYFPMDTLSDALGLKALVHVGDGFTPGPPSRVVTADGVPSLSPMICYEGLFPAAVSDGGTRAAWIVNVSNDAWFGKTSGPLQHYNMARYRAIEEGLPMVRATPTGVSAVVDAFGRPQAELGLGAFGVIDHVLPRALPGTPYHRYRDLAFWILTILSLTPIALSRIVAGGGLRLSASSYLGLHMSAHDTRQGGQT